MRFANHLFLDQYRTACWVYIRLNACSAFKRLIVAGLPEPERHDPRLPMGRITQLRGADRTGAAAAEKRLFVIRDPLERVVSGFLRQVALKVATPYPEMFDGIEAATGQDRHDVTFDSFVHRYLCGRDWDEINPHFRPMRDHLGDLVYTHVLHDRTLREDVAGTLGQDKAGPFPAGPARSTAKADDGDGAKTLTTAQLAALVSETKRLPAVDAFLTPPLRERLSERYAADMHLYADYLSARRANGDRPPQMDMRLD